MLGFFRKYQRFFFLFITVIIVISFSFFGTYSTIPSTGMRDQIAFTAIDGSEISRAELDEMVRFLETDNQDKVLFGGHWGPNFLNDGVISQDILQTGIAQLLAAQFPNEIEHDYQMRLAKEKAYALYVHPQANFISTETAWSYFAPDMKAQFDALRKSENPLDDASFAARVKLYLGEKQFSSPLLRQVLHYQEKQYNWVPPDANLDRTNLSLFGYHTLTDWFGPRFVRISAEFIINSAKIAEKQGYSVSKAEALAELIHNSDSSFKQNFKSPNLAVASSQEYFNEQLRLMGMDKNMAVKIWQNVLLFRRLYQDAGNAVFVDPNTFANFVQYAKESASGDIYQLPKSLQLNDFRALQKFETYLSAISKRGEDENSLLGLPKTFLSVAEVTKNSPELVQKRYLLEISHLDKNMLLPKVGVKETWNWEVEESNWALLKKEFPELGVKKGSTREERYAALDSLDTKTRSKVDAYSRGAILENHPEWLTKALQDAESKTISVGLPLKGAAAPFIGVEDALPLITLLDASPIASGEVLITKNQNQAEANLSHYTADKRNYYKIRVLERIPDVEIITFGEADHKKILDKILDRKLEASYPKIREEHAELFQKSDKTWKPFEDVKDLVADFYFAKILKAINNYAAKNGSADKTQKLSGNLAAPKRLLQYVTDIQDKIKKNPNDAGQYIKDNSETPSSDDHLVAAEHLNTQWKLEKHSFAIDRCAQHDRINSAEAIAMGINEWSKVDSTPNGAIYFFEKKEAKNADEIAMIDEKVDQARRLLGDETQRTLASRLITDFKSKNAISLAYLNNDSQTIMEE